MSTQELGNMEQAEKRVKRKKNLPCIYDPAIRKPCLVREAIVNIKAPMRESIAKYTLPKEIAGFTAGIDGIFSAMGQALHSELSLLTPFCAECPHLKTFTEKEYYAFHEERMKTMKQRRRERRKRKT